MLLGWWVVVGLVICFIWMLVLMGDFIGFLRLLVVGLIVCCVVIVMVSGGMRVCLVC